MSSSSQLDLVVKSSQALSVWVVVRLVQVTSALMIPMSLDSCLIKNAC